VHYEAENRDTELSFERGSNRGRVVAMRRSCDARHCGGYVVVMCGHVVIVGWECENGRRGPLQWLWLQATESMTRSNPAGQQQARY
jgi:hypothetical protein